MAAPHRPAGPEVHPYARRHVRFGWWSLLVFALLGLVLELLHGFKIGFYLDVENETRRLMWTLAHAHGVLLGVLHLAFGFAIQLGFMAERVLRSTSRLLLASSVLLPGGFFLGGATVFGGDPNPAVLVTPLGALALLVALGLAARGAAPER